MRGTVLACLAAAALLGGSSTVLAQVNPIVRMSVTAPDGTVQEVTAPESGTATITLKDGTAIGVRPTILDSRPWTRVVVSFFKMPTPTHSTEEIGSVEVKTGAAAIQSKTSPAFKVAVTSVTDSASSATHTSR